MKPSEKELKCILFASQYLCMSGKGLGELLYSKEELAPIDVSPVKTFEQLWSDFGLRNYGINYWHRGIFTDEQKMECLAYWAHELYPFPIDLKQLEREIAAMFVQRRKAYYEKNPNGHITTAEPINCIPREIDKRYGPYEK